MCPCRFIDYSRCATLVWAFESGEDCVCILGAEGIWEISVPSAQYSCEPKLSLKNKVYFKKSMK